ncbi:MAG: YfhO family protein [Butyrivibrio sp.]|nr:YfhO family protein [Butyrivibrio sp.]MBP3813498.1 YfhO family protein [Butyrivibrio sp.]
MSTKTKIFLQYVVYSILFILVSYMVFRFFPENNKFLINHADTWRQYIKAVAYNSKWMRGFIYHLFKEKSLLPQTLSYGMGYGNDIYPTLQYYAIGDILNIPSVFVKVENIYIYIQITTILRPYLAGIAISLYLRYVRPELSWISVMCGMFTYAFGTYFMYYGTWHPYFANPLIYLPLVLLGAEKIFREKKPLTFIIAIFLSAINNFYFFYLIVLITVIYCIVRAFFLYGKDFSTLLKTVGTFLLSGIVGTMMSMVILLPVLFAFMHNSRSDQDIIFQMLYSPAYYKELAANLISFVIHGEAETQLGFTILIIPAMLFILYKGFLDKRDRQATVFMVIMAACLCIPYAGYVFSGFAFVSNRWSFACAVFAGYAMAVFTDDLVRSLTTKFSFKFKNPVITVSQVVVFALTICLIGKNAYAGYSPEAGNMVGDYLDMASTEDMYLQLQSTEVQVVEEAAVQDGLDAVNDFYRYSGRNLVWNASLLDGITSTQFFWSLDDRGVSDYIRDMGVTDQESHAYYALDDRAILNLMGGVNYFSLRFNTPEERAFVPYSYYEDYDKYNFAIFRNDRALPYGSTCNKVIPRSDFENMSVIERQEALLYGIVLDDKDAEGFEKAEPVFTSSSAEYKITASEGIEFFDNGFKAEAGSGMTIEFEGRENAENYLFFKNLNIDADTGVVSLVVNTKLSDGTEIKKQLDYQTKQSQNYSGWHDYIINMGYSPEPKSYYTITFGAGTYTYDSMEVLFQPLDGLDERLSAFTQNTLENLDLHKNPISYATNKVTGDINLEEPKIMLLSTPYLSGWTAYVDGKKTELLRANTMFTALPLSEGYHEIELRYHTPGLLAGLILSILGVVLAIVVKRVYDRKGTS